MSLRKHGTGEVLRDDSTPVQKTASDSSQQQRLADLAAENAAADDEKEE